MAVPFTEITDSMLVAAIDGEVARAEYQGKSLLAQERSLADYAYTNLFIPRTEPTTGMSSILSNVIQPAVDTPTSYLTNIFCSDQDTVVFNTEDEDLAPKAREIGDLINRVIHKKNDGYHIISEMIKDAYLHKTSVVKVIWDDNPESFKYQFNGTQAELAISMAEKEFEGWECTVIEKEKVYDTITAKNEATGEEVEAVQESFEAAIKCTKNKSQPRIVNIPPEEFLINEGATSINDCELTRFCCHRQLVFISDLVEMFPDVDVDTIHGAAGFLDNEFEIFARHAFDGTYHYGVNTSEQAALRQVELHESWIRSDRDGDGIAEWRHVFSAGTTLLSDEEWFSDIPFASFTPFTVPHKFYGQGVFDLIQDEYIALTGLIRAGIDITNIKNTPRFFGNPRHIDIRSFKSGLPGIIPTSLGFDPKTLVEVPIPSGSVGDSMTMITHLLSMIKAKIGVDIITGTISTEVEKSGNDAAKTEIAVSNASAKIETMARRFAETAMRDIIWICYDLMVQYEQIEDAGLEKSDLVAKVGLGHQTGQQRITAAASIVQQQTALTEAGVSIPPKYLLAAAKNVAHTLGEQDPGLYFPPAEEIEEERKRLEQMAMQAAQGQAEMAQAAQAESSENSAAKRRLEEAKATEAEVKANHTERKLMAEEERTVIEMDNIGADNELNRDRQLAQEEQMAANLENQNADRELRRYEAELRAKAAIEVAAMNNALPMGDGDLNDIKVD